VEPGNAEPCRADPEGVIAEVLLVDENELELAIDVRTRHGRSFPAVGLEGSVDEKVGKPIAKARLVGPELDDLAVGRGRPPTRARTRTHPWRKVSTLDFHISRLCAAGRCQEEAPPRDQTARM
jgi:hypothetical protein